MPNKSYQISTVIFLVILKEFFRIHPRYYIHMDVFDMFKPSSTKYSLPVAKGQYYLLLYEVIAKL